MRWKLLTAALWLAPAAAAADAIPGPPTDCPPGSEGRTSHAGTYCAATSCATDVDCEGGRVCREAPLCVREVTITYNTYEQRGAERSMSVAIRACPGGAGECPPDAAAHVGHRGGGRDLDEAHQDDGARVEGPARCLTERRCVEAPDAAEAPETDETDADETDTDEASSALDRSSADPGAGGAVEDPGPAAPAGEAEGDGGGCAVGRRAGGAGLALPWAVVGALVLPRRRGRENLRDRR